MQSLMLCKSLTAFRTSKPLIDNDTVHWRDLFVLSPTQQGFTPSAPVPVFLGPLPAQSPPVRCERLPPLSSTSP